MGGVCKEGPAPNSLSRSTNMRQGMFLGRKLIRRGMQKSLRYPDESEPTEHRTGADRPDKLRLSALSPPAPVHTIEKGLCPSSVNSALRE